MIELGQKVRCKVTGLTGIATARCEYLNGCIQICVTPRSRKIEKDDDVWKGTYIDIDYLEVVKGGIKIRRKDAGGPQPNEPPSRPGR